MASSAVSSVLYLCDAAGNHAETRTGAYIYDGNSALDYALLVILVVNTLKRCLKSVIDRVATLSSQHKKWASINLCEIDDGRPCGVDTLINHMRGMGFSFDCRPGGPLSRQKMGNV